MSVPRSVPLPEIVEIAINDSVFIVEALKRNSLNQDICFVYGLEGVEFYTVQTRLPADHMLVLANTHALIYFSSEIMDLNFSQHVDLCARVSNYDEKFFMEIFTYKNGSYFKQDYDFYHGELGCTAMVNLGLFLLRLFASPSVKALSAVTFVNARSTQPEGVSERVDDSSIVDFCRTNNAEIIPVENEASDCQYWSECQNQPGFICKFLDAKCF